MTALLQLFRLRKAEPQFKLTASDMARDLAKLGAEKRRQEYAHRLRLTTMKLRYEVAAGVTSPLAPTEGWRR